MNANVADVLAVLSRTPSVLRALLEDMPAAWLGATEGEGTFSPADVVGHLSHAERTDWMPRVRHILTVGESQPFAPFDRFGFRETLGQRSLGALVAEFEALRQTSLNDLRELRLTPEQLELKGRHPELGPVTLGQLLGTWAVHDLNHVGQVVRVMSKSYSAAVGPWKAYLGILNR